jgi:hypothetical protein
MQTDGGKRVTLTTDDPVLKAAFARGTNTNEILRQLVKSGMGDKKFHYTSSEHEDVIARTIAEMHGKLSKDTKGTVSVRQVLDAFKDTERTQPDPDPDNVFIPEMGQNQTAALVDTVNEMADKVARSDPDRPANIEQWAADVEAAARAKGYTGSFTPETAHYYRDVWEASGKDVDKAQSMFDVFKMGARAATGNCDFCDDPNPVWGYPCESFQMETPGGQPWGSDGGWAACEQCASCIERNDRQQLVNRYLNTKPKEFRDIIRPWGTRLHNRFFRFRNGDREPIMRPAPEGYPEGITVVSADDLEAAESLGAGDIAAHVRATGEPALSVINPATGESVVIASGMDAIEGTTERQRIIKAYGGHPLLERYLQHMRSMQRREGRWRNTDGWHALAEKYAFTLTAANTLGVPGMDKETGAAYFDPQLLATWPNDPQFLNRMGLYIMRELHDAVPYLWMSNVDEIANEPDLPPHHVTRGLAPHPAMFWSFEAAMGDTPDALIDWVLIVETTRGYEVWCPLSNDTNDSGRVMISGALIPYGAKWPDDLRSDEEGNHGLPEFLLKRLAFLNSKYVEAPHIRAHRSVRRDVERQLKKIHQPLPDDMGAFVVHLRQPEPRPARSSADEGGREINRQHCWWRRAHTRIIYRKTPRERATWVRATLMGDTNLPLIRKTYVVDR